MTDLRLRVAVCYLIFTILPAGLAGPINRFNDGEYEESGNAISSGQQNVCRVGDKLYEAGDTVPRDNSCEHCICTGPGLTCSRTRCETRPGCRAMQHPEECCPQYICECERNGRVYQNGEKLDDPESPCEACYCQGGNVTCTSVKCYERHDCKPQYMPGVCCPKYDDCPPLENSKLKQTQSTSEEMQSDVPQVSVSSEWSSEVSSSTILNDGKSGTSTEHHWTSDISTRSVQSQDGESESSTEAWSIPDWSDEHYNTDLAQSGEGATSTEHSTDHAPQHSAAFQDGEIATSTDHSTEWSFTNWSNEHYNTDLSQSNEGATSTEHSTDHAPEHSAALQDGEIATSTDHSSEWFLTNWSNEHYNTDLSQSNEGATSTEYSTQHSTEYSTQHSTEYSTDPQSGESATSTEYHGEWILPQLSDPDVNYDSAHSVEGGTSAGHSTNFENEQYSTSTKLSTGPQSDESALSTEHNAQFQQWTSEELNTGSEYGDEGETSTEHSAHFQTEESDVSTGASTDLQMKPSAMPNKRNTEIGSWNTEDIDTSSTEDSEPASSTEHSTHYQNTDATSATEHTTDPQDEETTTTEHAELGELARNNVSDTDSAQIDETESTVQPSKPQNINGEHMMSYSGSITDITEDSTTSTSHSTKINDAHMLTTISPDNEYMTPEVSSTLDPSNDATPTEHTLQMGKENVFTNMNDNENTSFQAISHSGATDEVSSTPFSKATTSNEETKEIFEPNTETISTITEHSSEVSSKITSGDAEGGNRALAVESSSKANGMASTVTALPEHLSDSTETTGVMTSTPSYSSHSDVRGMMADITSHYVMSNDMTSTTDSPEEEQSTSAPPSSEDITSHYGTSDDMTSSTDSPEEEQSTSAPPSSEDITSHYVTTDDMTSSTDSPEEEQSTTASPSDVNSEDITSNDMTSTTENSKEEQSTTAPPSNVNSEDILSNDMTSTNDSPEEEQSTTAPPSDVSSEDITSNDMTSTTDSPEEEQSTSAPPSTSYSKDMIMTTESTTQINDITLGSGVGAEHSNKIIARRSHNSGTSEEVMSSTGQPENVSEATDNPSESGANASEETSIYDESTTSTTDYSTETSDSVSTTTTSSSEDTVLTTKEDSQNKSSVIKTGFNDYNEDVVGYNTELINDEGESRLPSVLSAESKSHGSVDNESVKYTDAESKDANERKTVVGENMSATVSIHEVRRVHETIESHKIAVNHQDQTAMEVSSNEYSKDEADDEPLGHETVPVVQLQELSPSTILNVKVTTEFEEDITQTQSSEEIPSSTSIHNMETIYTTQLTSKTDTPHEDETSTAVSWSTDDTTRNTDIVTTEVDSYERISTSTESHTEVNDKTNVEFHSSEDLEFHSNSDGVTTEGIPIKQKMESTDVYWNTHTEITQTTKYMFDSNDDSAPASSSHDYKNSYNSDLEDTYEAGSMEFRKDTNKFNGDLSKHGSPEYGFQSDQSMAIANSQKESVKNESKSTESEKDGSGFNKKSDEQLPVTSESPPEMNEDSTDMSLEAHEGVRILPDVIPFKTNKTATNETYDEYETTAETLPEDWLKGKHKSTTIKLNDSTVTTKSIEEQNYNGETTEEYHSSEEYNSTSLETDDKVSDNESKEVELDTMLMDMPVQSEEMLELSKDPGVASEEISTQKYPDIETTESNKNKTSTQSLKWNHSHDDTSSTDKSALSSDALNKEGIESVEKGTEHGMEETSHSEHASNFQNEEANSTDANTHVLNGSFKLDDVDYALEQKDEPKRSIIKKHEATPNVMTDANSESSKTDEDTSETVVTKRDRGTSLQATDLQLLRDILQKLYPHPHINNPTMEGY